MWQYLSNVAIRCWGVEGMVQFSHYCRPYWWMPLINQTPSCLCATKPPFLHERVWPTVNLSPHTHRLGRSTRGKLYCKLSESLNSCLLRAKPWSVRGIAFNQELVPLSLEWLTSHSRSGEKVKSMLSISSLSRALLSDWWCLLTSSVELSPGTINILCDVIESRSAYWLRGSKLLWRLSSQIWHAQTPLSRHQGDK